MSQVFIEFTQVARSSGSKDTPVTSYLATVEEITSSGTSQATSGSTDDGKDTVVTVMNNGTDTIWVNFGAVATAATPSRPVAPNTTRDFGGFENGLTVNVINDS